MKVKEATIYFPIYERRKEMKILTIDDNKEIIGLLDIVLTAMGHKIFSTTDGKEGLKLIQRNSYDVIVLDISMPNFSGLDIIDELEKCNTLKNHKIILFTGSTLNEKTANELLEKGVRGILRKPIEVEELEKEINNLL